MFHNATTDNAMSKTDKHRNFVPTELTTFCSISSHFAPALFKLTRTLYSYPLRIKRLIVLGPNARHASERNALKLRA